MILCHYHSLFLFQPSQVFNLRAMEFRGCSKLKNLSVTTASKQSSAAILAMRVSSSNFLFLEAGSFAKTLGIPSENSSFLRGLNENLTTGIGRSLALEKVEQLGAQCLNSETLNSESNKGLLRKTSNPLSKSQGSRTAFFLLRLSEEVWKVLCPPGRLAAGLPGRRCP